MKTIFWLRATNHINQKTIMIRISHNGQRKDFSSGLTVDKNDWLGGGFLIANTAVNAAEKNAQLASHTTDLLRAYNYLLLTKLPITPNKIYEAYLNINVNLTFKEVKIKIPSIMTVVTEAMKESEEQIGVSIVNSSFKAYVRYQNNFYKYLKSKSINPSTTPITAFNQELANDFLMSLFQKFKLKSTYTNKHKEFIRIIYKYCFENAEGWQLKLLPNKLTDFKEPKPDTSHLTVKQVLDLRNLKIVDPKFDRIRDMFSIMIDWGTHLVDYCNLVKYGQIERDISGSFVIRGKRQKSGVDFMVFITAEVARLINKYEGLRNLPIYSDQRANDYLKIVGYMAGIQNIVMSTKIGRKTFANTKLNVDKMDLLAIQECMGLTSPDYLKHYAKSNVDRIKDQMDKTNWQIADEHTPLIEELSRKSYNTIQKAA